MILVFGGTSDSLLLMEQLVSLDVPLTLSVATDYGRIAAAKFAQYVQQQRLTTDEMIEFIQDHEVQLVVDATHPFADLVSTNAIAACQSCQIPYIRYERPRVEYPESVHRLASIDDAIEQLNQRSGRIYLTTGSKDLPHYTKGLDLDRLTARILPTASVLSKCEDLGLTAGHIHALKGPFSYELNQALYTLAQADIMLTKESGSSGGVEAKVQAALDLGMEVWLIERPSVDYPQCYHQLEPLVVEIKSQIERSH